MLKTRFGRCIYQSPSGIKVYQNLLYRWMTLDSEILQTLIHRKKPQNPALSYIKPLCALAKSQPGQSCMLGLGGAAAAHYLLAASPQPSITVIENNHEVIDIATRYFMTAALELDIKDADAFDYLQTPGPRYKHLIIDLYQSDSYPQHCQSEEFFAACRARLDDDGLLAVNLANPGDHFKLLQTIKKQFGQATVSIPVPGSSNLIILSGHGEKLSTITSSLMQAIQIRQLHWDRDWGCIARL